MRPSLALHISKVHLTLFTRASCGLCDVAKSRIAEFNKKNQQQPTTTIDYTEIDIAKPDHQKWKDVYDFDVPVLHIDRVAEQDGARDFETSLDAARKLMHRFTAEEIVTAVDQVLEEKDVAK